MPQLEIGDVIYQKYRYSIPDSILTIERVTKTQAISGNRKFKRDYTEGQSLTMIGQSVWALVSYYVETPELKKKYERGLLLNQIQNTKWPSLSDEKLSAILDILNDKTPEK